jgi:tetratricopeptide (TPR) repeat protein
MKLIKMQLTKKTRFNVTQTKQSIAKHTRLAMWLLLSTVSLSAVGLSGCATTQHTSDNPTPNLVEAQTGEAALTADFIYQYLVAEVAGQRGDYATSSSIFYQLAKTEEDARFAERAAKTAAYGNIANLVYPSVELWAKLDPNSTEAQQAITEILIKSGKLSEAEPYLAQLLANERTRAAGFLFVNNLLNKSPNKEEVLKLTQKLAEPYPNLAEAQFSIAQAAISADQNKLALEALNKAEQFRPGWSLAALLKGQLLFAESPESAIKYYQSFVKKYPKTNEVRLNLAKILVSQKQYALAKKEFPIILKQAKAEITNDKSKADPSNLEAITKSLSEKNLADITAIIGLLALQGNDFAAANNYFQDALNLNFKDPEQLYLYLGQVAEKQQQDSIATDWYKKVAAGPHYLEAQLNIAQRMVRSQSVDAAIKYLDEVDNLNTEQQIVVIQSQAAMLAKAKRPQEAFNLLDKAVKNMPNTAELVYDYALAAERILKFDLMESELRKAIAAKPDFAAAYNALGYSFADRNIKLDEAIELIKKALNLAPNDHYMLDSLGWAYYRKGDLDQAMTYLQQAFKINPDPEIAAHLGEVLWQKGQHDAAKKIWDDALSADPNNEVLQTTAKKFKS